MANTLFLNPVLENQLLHLELQPGLLLNLLDLVQEYPGHLQDQKPKLEQNKWCGVSRWFFQHEREREYHDMRSNPDAIYWKSSVKFEGPSCLQRFHGTIKRACVGIFPLSIRLHFLDLGFDIVEWQTASCRKKSRYGTGPWSKIKKKLSTLPRN